MFCAPATVCAGAIEDELRDLNVQYSSAVAQLKGMDASEASDQMAGHLRGIVLSMERKSAQLATVRRSHNKMLDEISAAREEVIRTRSALEETAETAAARWRRIQTLEGC